MDFGTSITDRGITTDAPREPDRNRANINTRSSQSADTVGTSTVGNEGGKSQDISPTSSLPESIWTSWGEIARANMSVRMYGDLVRLASAPDGWRGDGSLSLRPRSLKNFLEFWSIVRGNAAEPELALAPDGTLHAEWFETTKKRLDVRFAEQNLFFGLFANNRIVEGAEHLNLVAQILMLHPSQPLNWSAR